MDNNVRWDIEDEIKQIAIEANRYFGVQVMINRFAHYQEKDILKVLFDLSSDTNLPKIKLQLNYTCPIHKDILFSHIAPIITDGTITTYINHQFNCNKCSRPVFVTPEATYMGFTISDEYYNHVNSHRSNHTLRNFKS
ncbi:hypothetical protein NSQ20_12510 [Paenibacillus sp. FSL K6-1122]|uniref:hypothetical protein n=1 Tax=Paenibacillus sp. FSL K6-1122 TaxID=2954512 RepID=UPI0030EE6C64